MERLLSRLLLTSICSSVRLNAFWPLVNCSTISIAAEIDWFFYIYYLFWFPLFYCRNLTMIWSCEGFHILTLKDDETRIWILFWNWLQASFSILGLFPILAKDNTLLITLGFNFFLYWKRIQSSHRGFCLFAAVGV